jgi:hypothetical protein
MLRAAWGWVRRNWTYIDVAVAFIGGVVVAALGLLDKLKDDELTQATVAVLSVLALSLLHDRVGRERHRRYVAAAIDGIAQRIDEGGSHAYHQMSSVATWDIEQPDLSTTIREKEIRFLHDDVIAISERAQAAGNVVEHRVLGGRPNQPLVELQMATRPVLDDRARPMWVVALDRRWRAGEVMHIRSERKLRDTFLDPIEEYVQISLDHPTDSLRMNVIWPANKAPTELWVSRSEGGTGNSVTIPLGALRRRNGRQALVNHPIPSPQMGETIKLTWRW